MRLILISLVLSTLVACSSKNETVPITPPVEIRTVQVERPKPLIPEPKPVSMKPVEWEILTKDNVDEKIGKEGVYYALKVSSYENLILNLNEIRGYIESQKKVISAYKSN